MSQELTREYVEQHSTEVHTYESFGRSLIAQVLKECINKVGVTPGDTVKIDTNIIVTTVEITRCLEVRVTVGGAYICKHVKVD